jgi:uncharacterized membrane protein
MARRESFGSDFKRFFGRGLAILLPSIVTLWLLWQAFSFLIKTVAGPINRGIRWAYVWTAPQIVGEDAMPPWFVPGNLKLSAENFRAIWNEYLLLDAIGLLVAMGLVYLAGVMLGGFFGRQVYSRLEALISKIPGFKQVYPHVKQVVDLIMGEKAMAFNRVVLVEWPRREAWTLGFVTGDSFEKARIAVGVPMVSVFIPTTPTPFTGFIVNVPESEVMDMPLSIDEALRFIITAGVLKPEKDKAARSALDRADAPPPVKGIDETRELIERAKAERGTKPGPDAPA